MKLFNKTLLAVAVTLASSQVMAAGFQLNSQSATGLGRAFAGDAVIADNASVLSRNPAAMAMFDSAALSMGLAVADVSVEVKDVNFIVMDPQNPAFLRNDIDDAGSTKLIPNFYYINPVNDRFAFGVAAFTNFGTGTDTSGLKKDSNALTTPHDLIGETAVTSVTLNASVSFRINEMLSLGAGLDAIYGQGTLSREAPPVPQLGLPNGVAMVDVDADGWGFGGIVGATLELNDNHRFGLSYRFSPNMEVSGDINIFDSASKQIVNFDKLEVPLADIFQFAGFHQLSNRFAVHYTAQMTQWSNFDQITLKDGSIAGTHVVDQKALKDYSWQDSWLFSIGGTYDLNDMFTLRAGYMFDNGVVDQKSSISIPDSDRNWYTAGLTFHLSAKSDIDFGVAFVRGEEVEVNEKSDWLVGLPFGSPGEVNATTKSSALYYSLQYSYRF